MNYNELKFKVESLGYEFFIGDLNLNFIWERTSDIITNKFTDFLHIAYQENGQDNILSIACTTKPGIKGSIDSPVTVDGVTGTAVIIPGQYKGAWQYIEINPSRGYPFNGQFFQQIKPINYWRDGNKVLYVEHIQEQDNKIFGTNWHKMSNEGASGFDINNWSEGCMGAESGIWESILPLVRRSIAKYGPIFTGTLITTF